MAFTYHTDTMQLISNIMNNPWFVPVIVAVIGIFMIVLVFIMIQEAVLNPRR
jgi:hypothetical protein